MRIRLKGHVLAKPPNADVDIYDHKGTLGLNQLLIKDGSVGEPAPSRAHGLVMRIHS